MSTDTPTKYNNIVRTHRKTTYKTRSDKTGKLRPVRQRELQLIKPEESALDRFLSECLESVLHRYDRTENNRGAAMERRKRLKSAYPGARGTYKGDYLDDDTEEV